MPSDKLTGRRSVPTGGDTSQMPAHPGLRWRLAAGGIALLLVVGWGIQTTRARRAALASLPEVDLSGVEAQVAAKLEDLVKAVRANPTSPSAWGAYAMNLDAHGFPNAVRAYEQAARLDPEDFRWPYLAGIVLQGLESPSAAEWFQRARSLRPDYLPLLVRLGQTLARLSMLDDAESAFREALDLTPANARAYFGLAKIAFTRDDLVASESLLVAAQELEPRFGEAYSLLGEVYRRRNLPSDADRALRKAQYFSDTPALPDTVFIEVMREGVSSFWYGHRGKLYLKAAMYDAAEREFRQAVEARPNAETHTYLGLTYQRSGRPREAAEQYRRALARTATHREALIGLGLALFDLGQTQEGIGSIEEAIALKPTAPDAYFELGTLFERSGRVPRAVDVYRRGLTQAEYSPRLGARLAWWLATCSAPELRNGSRAVQFAEAASEMTGHRDPVMLDVLGAAYAADGQFGKAIDVARRAAEVARQDGLGRFATQIESRQRLYQSGTPVAKGGDDGRC